jgi:hypothetical protein
MLKYRGNSGRLLFMEMVLLSVAFSLNGGCNSYLPRPVVRYPRPTPEPCFMPPPPPALVLKEGADLSRCLPQNLETDVEINVEVSSDGQAIGVSQAVSVCFELNADGTIPNLYTLNEKDKQCILRYLQDWRFAAVETCHKKYAYVSVKSCDSCVN